MRVEDSVEDHKYILRAELPGMDPEHDIKITVEGEELCINAQRTEEKRPAGRTSLPGSLPPAATTR
ncbi:Hsp20/alpha crystallin family protein [Qaidamihabitans albus]|uniref:Hsp20/alpha crystallin family protein n=1 Tax=Qaidamihabitans albus TaxID=2795733 RepID=UPI003558AD24